MLAEDFNTKKSELSLAVQIGGFAKAVAKGIVQLVTVPLPTTTVPAESLPAIVGDPAARLNLHCWIYSAHDSKRAGSLKGAGRSGISCGIGGDSHRVRARQF